MTAEKVQVQKVQKLIEGLVVSTKMHKTIVVEVERRQKHEKYGKMVKAYTKLYVHDETERSKEGDKVRVKECRPFSKTKAWELVEVVDSKG